MEESLGFVMNSIEPLISKEKLHVRFVADRVSFGRENDDPSIVIEVFFRDREDARVKLCFCMDGVKGSCIGLD